MPVTLSAKVTHTDNQSGVNINKCKYILNNSNEELGTDANNYTNIFSSNEQTIRISLTSATNWYLHVLTVDTAGNAIETVSRPIEVMANYHVHLGDTSSGGECYLEETTTVATPHSITEIWPDVNNEGYSFIKYSCGKTLYSIYSGCGCTTTVTSYTLNCGKTEKSIDSVTITY